MSKNNLRTNSPRYGGWLRKLVRLAGILVVLLVVLLVVVFFVATSSAFLKGVILPRVSKALGADVTVAEAQISPFSHVQLRDLKVQPPGGEPLLTVREMHANYSLLAIIGGNIVVSEVAIESPVVTVVQNADGTCNLDALTKPSAKETKPATPAPSTPSRPPQIDIKKVSLNNATVRLVKKYPNGGQDVTEVSGLNFTVNGLKNGQSGKIALAAAIAVKTAAQTNAAAGSLQAGLNGGFDFALTQDLKPASVKGSTSFTVNQAAGLMADFNAFAAMLNCDLTATDLKELAFRLTKADALLAQIRISGPFDAAKTEGKLKLEISGVDKKTLNLAGAASGMDFGPTTFNCTNDIELGKGGRMISLAGNFDLAHLQVKQKTQTSPMLDLHGDYSVTVDQTAQSAVLQKLNLAGTQDSRALLQISLSSPMTIPLGGTSSGVGDAALNLNVNNLNLADWKSFAGEAAPGGVLNLTVKLLSQKAGQQLGFQVDTHLDNLTTGTGSASVNQGNVRVQVSGSVADMKLVKLDDYQVDVVRQGKSLVKVSGSATFDSTTQDADLQVAVQAALAQLMAVPGASPADGAVGFKGHVTSKQKKIGLTGELALTPTGRAKNTLQLNGDVDIAQADAITGSFKLAAESLDVTHYYDLLSSIKPAATNNPTAATSGAPASSPDKEPDAMKLPLKNFTFDLNIGHLFLREVDIANWQTTALLDGGHVVVKPCELTLNGAPVKATTDLNLSVPGYTYDVGFNADAIPLAPLVNSFAPDRKGQIAGTTSIGVQVKGAGVTGAGLQKNLAGQFNFAATNMNLSIANVRSPLISSIINVIIGLPDLIRNPVAALGNLLGGGTKKSGWADALTSSPIDEIAMQAGAGDGQVKLQSAEVRSAAFQALASGQIVLAPNLTNSTIAIPVQVMLSRSLAGQIGLVDANTPTNAVYVALPDFLKMEGTIGKPQTKIDKLALVELAAKTGGGVIKGIGGAGGEKAGSVLNAVSGLLGGGKSATTNATPATTNAPPADSLLNLFKKKK
ncbi:MAG: AsmA family protein [Verrucomicrobiales bacterium]|nr:AsmA family protein [Verrucomicrobiales bacterium]